MTTMNKESIDINPFLEYNYQKASSCILTY